MLDVVTTTLGPVSGLASKVGACTISSFRGIPYAAPPVGVLRWAPPADAEPWVEVRKTTEFAPGALQQFHNDWFSREGYVIGHYGEEPPMSEDCLYLNIATPALDAGEKLPVYVWFHGGGLTNGFAAEAATDPHVLASRGIIVVHVSHRINVFGYLALPQLRAERGTSGNYGFMDQLKAMDWIHQNIEAFGGDPTNITVGGQSGGAQKAAALAAVPTNQGHVRRVVSVSGLKWMQPLFEQSWAEKHGQQYLESIGVPVDATLEELRELDSSIFLTPVKRDLLPDYMVTDQLLPYANLREGIDKHGIDVDFLNGMVLGETDVFAQSSSNQDFRPASPPAPFTSAEEFQEHFRALLGDLYESSGFASIVEVTDANAWETARALAAHGLAGNERTNISRNLMLNRVFGRYLESVGGSGSVYDYLWSHRVPASPHDAGTPRDPANALSWHGADTWYVFGTLQPDVSRDRPWRPNDRRLADIMTSYIAAFVATGNPNRPGLPYWPCANDDFGYIEVDGDVVAHVGCTTELDVLTERFVEREYRLEGLMSEVKSTNARIEAGVAL